MENDFYDEEYNLTSWKPEPYELMANILCDVFKLEENKSPEIIDVGCGVGYLVESFRRRGIEAGGIEFSKQIYNRISEETKNMYISSMSIIFITNLSLVALNLFYHLKFMNIYL